MSAKTALLVIDVQAGMFNETFRVHDGQRLLVTVGRLLGQARAAQLPVIYVQHCGDREQHPLYPAGPGFPIHPAIAPQANELVAQKHTPDSFHETVLHEALQAQAITQLVICGIQTDYCVDTSVRRAHSLGYDVTLAQDGHSTWPDSGLSADQIIAHHNTVLGNWFAKVIPAEQIFSSIHHD